MDKKTLKQMLQDGQFVKLGYKLENKEDNEPLKYSTYIIDNDKGGFTSVEVNKYGNIAAYGGVKGDNIYDAVYNILREFKLIEDQFTTFPYVEKDTTNINFNNIFD